ADQVGGPEAMRAITLQTGRVVPSEIHLKNGSGLEQDNKLSPRAVVGLFQAIQTELDTQNLTLATLFPTLGQDKGTVEKRHFPKATVVKTGTLWNTSGLAGMLPTRRYGPVWFAIMNRGDDFTDGFRNAQDRFLQDLIALWGTTDPTTATTVTADPGTVQRRKALDAFLQADFLSH
ncbi:MAG: D-alanyl-D-alanine carboxypeptidase, partial [Thermosynechococcaceae cyanobacterium]